MHITYRQQARDTALILLGISIYAVGFTAFVLPDKTVMGGLTGLSALIYYATRIPPALSLWTVNVFLLILAWRALSRQFALRTIMGVTALSVAIGAMQPFFAAHPLITPGEDRFMHVFIGGAICGAGLGVTFGHNGSTGGTDILVAIMNRYLRLSFGRAMQLIDCCIIASSWFLFHSAEQIVYGVAFTLVCSYTCDFVINGSRQTVQFVIISREYERIADAISRDLHRGVTLVDGKGWYSKQPVSLLIVLARKHESGQLLRYIKQIDPRALVSESFCHGVFGEGFDNLG